ncbi:hypothetical protein LJC55_03035 [Eubacteriales bacterium OttesenSCG-928-N14]|nr:hypothetical protein [Eubacteriales bacterium OttesenSCG-928-N14]
METGAYLFAIFVFLLIVLSIWLFVKLTKRSAALDDNAELKEKERRLFRIYQNLEDMMQGMEEYVEESKIELQTQREQINAMMEKAEAIVKSAKVNADTIAVNNALQAASAAKQESTAAKVDISAIAPPEQPKRKRGRPPKNRPVIADRGPGGQTYERVQQLNRLSMPEEDIAKQLSLSRGEVSLMLGMNKH